MMLSAFTILHVIVSLVAIASGLFVAYQMLNSQFSPIWTLVFLATTALTSITGFISPLSGFTPGIAFGIVSLVALAVAIYALYTRHLAGAWRWIYVVAALVALYLNVFLLVAQAFQKIPALNTLAPNGTEPPFVVAQGIVLVAFLWLGYLAVKKFRTRSYR